MEKEIEDDLSFTKDFHQDLILEIKAKIAERKGLSDKIREALEKMILDRDRLILKTKEQRPLDTSVYVERRTQLEKDITLCQRELLREDIACWQDITRLEAELRELVKERNLIGEDEG